MPKSELQSKVETWLKGQGYPLEMRTAQVLLKHGWLLQHSRRYEDPTTGKEREIDIIAFNDDKGDGSLFHGRLVVECKWSLKKPWVLFTSELIWMTPVGHLRSAAMNGTAAKALERLITREMISEFPLFSGHREGYAVVQALGNSAGIDAAYSAVLSTINAADFFASRSSEHAIIYMPTVILDGELYQCSLSKEGDISVKEIEIGLLIHHTADLPRCVHIVRESAVEEFVNRAEATFKSIRVALKNR